MVYSHGTVILITFNLAMTWYIYWLQKQLYYMKPAFLLYFTAIMLLGCTHSTDCIPGINLLPMYGHIKKCAAQIKSDKDFLKECDRNFTDRKKASSYYSEKAWTYYYANKQDTAMRRFNQAWLLDSLNADVYWGFGNLIGIQKKYKESLILFNRSLRLNASNSRVWESTATSYVQLFFQTKDVSFLNKSIDFLKGAVRLDPKSTRLYGELTTTYSYFNQKDSARKYLKIADKLGSNNISPEVRKIIAGN